MIMCNLKSDIPFVEAVAKGCLWMLLGWIIFAVMTKYSSDSYYNIVNNAIKECEKSLPRNKFCKIIAIPESDEK